MRVLLKVSGWIDEVNRYVGMIASCCILLLVLVGAGNATARYLSGIDTHTTVGQWFSGVKNVALAVMQSGGNAFLEIQTYLFATVFMLGASYVLRRNEHVRVDLFYGTLSHRGKLYVDVFGYIFFFLPVVLMILKFSGPFFWASYLSKETSANAAGLTLWPVKLLVPVSFTCLLFQGFSEFIKRIAAIRGLSAVDTSYEKPAQ